MATKRNPPQEDRPDSPRGYVRYGPEDMFSVDEKEVLKAAEANWEQAQKVVRRLQKSDKR